MRSPRPRRRRVLAAAALLPFLALAACVSSSEVRETERDGYAVASPVLKREIDQRIENLKYLHGKDLRASMARLIYIGEPAIPALVDVLASHDPKTRGSASYILGEIGDKRAIPAISGLLDDPVEFVRLEAAGALATLGDWTCLPTLIGALRHDNAAIRLKAFQVLLTQVKQDFGYVYNAPASERERAVERWEAWWKTAHAENLL